MTLTLSTLRHLLPCALLLLAACAQLPPDQTHYPVGRGQIVLPPGDWQDLGTTEQALPLLPQAGGRIPLQSRAVALRGPQQQLLAVLRVHQICGAAGVGGFSSDLLIFFGLLSMAFAAVFIVRQQDFKRMLAYSSVEHMGLIALGAGLGGLGGFAALLHALNHSCAKALLFMIAGNILSVYRTKTAPQVSGMLALLPVSAGCWIGGFLAIAGVPPFGLFISEFLIVKAAVDSGRPLVAVLCLVLLAVCSPGWARCLWPWRKASSQDERPARLPRLR